jgi:hypothetical protein
MRMAIAFTAAAAASTLLAAPAQAQTAPRAWIGLPTTITISVPQMYVGVPATVTARVTPANQTGSAAFWANYEQDGIAASQRVTNGTVSVTFTPGTTGWQTIGVSFTPDPQQGTTQAATSAVVNVQPGKGPDVVTLGAKPATLAPGAPATVSATTASGAAVTVATSGGCTYAAGQLTATSGTGTCTATFSSPGAGPYSPSAATTWTIPLQLGRQSAAITARASGTVPKWNPITLAPKGLTTNAGIAVRWSVTSGATSCQIGWKGDDVVLRTRAVGTCTVRAQAAAVPGVWDAYTATRTYRVQ